MCSSVSVSVCKSTRWTSDRAVYVSNKLTIIEIENSTGQHLSYYTTHQCAKLTTSMDKIKLVN